MKYYERTTVKCKRHFWQAHATIEIITLITNITSPGSQGARTTGVWAVGQILISQKRRYYQTNRDNVGAKGLYMFPLNLMIYTSYDVLHVTVTPHV